MRSGLCSQKRGFMATLTTPDVMLNKVVVAYLDGRRSRGRVYDFSAQSSSITEHSFQGITPSPKGKKCHPCVRYKLSPMCQAAQISIIPQQRQLSVCAAKNHYCTGSNT